MTQATWTERQRGREREETSDVKRAALYRMITDAHVCPYGIQSKWLLEREGFEVEDHILRDRAEVDAFKEDHDVDTTPQTFIGGVRVGGYEDLRKHFGKKVRDDDATRYQPVIAVFGVAALAALALAWAAFGTVLTLRTAEWFVALSMAMLAMLKLQDLRSFVTMFLGYDLLARRHVPYAYLYPFAEATAAILMLGGVLLFVAAPLALFIGTVGAVSVFKAVYVDKRELECACVGGGSKVPLGFVSLTENIAMVLMGIWMPLRMLLDL